MMDQAKMIKQAWDMKRKMDKVQNSLKKKEIEVVEGSVTVVITGDQKIKEIKLDPTIQELENIRELETSVKNAINKAIQASQDMVQDSMKDITGGLNIPGLTS